MVGFSNIADISAKLLQFWGGNQASGSVLTSTGEGRTPNFSPAAGGGLLVQQAYVENTTFTSIDNAQIPLDNSAPQITEGTQVMSLAFTPLDAANILTIEVVVNFSNIDDTFTACLFVVGTSSALACCTQGGPVSNLNMSSLGFKHRLVAGAGARTYTVRCGNRQAGTVCDFNGNSSGPKFSTSGPTSSILIWETTP